MSSAEGFGYPAMSKNMGAGRLIQVGLTLCDERGRHPRSPAKNNQQCVWQFNFSEFDEKRDTHNVESIKFLKDHGIYLDKNIVFGVKYARFAELLMSSGLLNEKGITWVTFQGNYDFGYLVKLVSGKELPDTREEFIKIFDYLFPTSFDVKVLMTKLNLYGGLSSLATQLEVSRVGTAHQAGSDSLTTIRVFLKIRNGEKYFNRSIPNECCGVVSGI